jgi:hypothetical protein
MTERVRTDSLSKGQQGLLLGVQRPSQHHPPSDAFDFNTNQRSGVEFVLTLA